MTLTEIMVVVIIMALIATAVAAAVLPALQSAKIRQTKADVAAVRSAVLSALLDRPDGACPAIDELQLDAAGRRIDAWDHPFEIVCEPGGPIVTSAGPDGEMGTQDDIRAPAGATRVE